MITLHESDDLERTRTFLGKALGPVWIPGIAHTPRQIPWYVLDDLASAPRTFLHAEEQGRLLGIAALRSRGWDTLHFGVQVASLDYLLIDPEAASGVREALLGGVDAWCRDRTIRLLSTRMHVADVASLHALEAAGFRTMDFLLNFLRQEGNSELPPAGTFPVDSPRPEEQEVLAQMAARGFVTDRFHKDARLDPEKSSEVYACWMRSALADPDQEVLVARDEGRPVGTMTLRVEKGGDDSTRMGVIDIIVASESHRGRGIASQMIVESLRRLRARGIGWLHASTQADNLSAVNCYLKLGFRIHQAAQTFHRWYDE